MEVARVIQSYFAVLAWPIVATLAIFWYRDVLRSLLLGAKVKLTIFGIEIETTIPVIEESLTQSTYGGDLTPESKHWLLRLKAGGREEIPVSNEHTHESALNALRPLRNAGLIVNYPQGFLQEAKTVQITELGKVVAKAITSKEGGNGSGTA